jgi:hypothetical protein
MIDLTFFWIRKSWAKFKAIDSDGFIWLFENKPTPSPSRGVWEAIGRQFYIKQVEMPHDLSWMTTLEERPEGL